MLKIAIEDCAALDSVLEEHSLEDVSSLMEVGAFIELSLPCFSDEQTVMDDLDFRGVGFSYILK